VTFDEALVSFDRAFDVVFLFGGLRRLIDLRGVAVYFFLARRHILRFVGFENDRRSARFRYK
jgi:hypothetical protein